MYRRAASLIELIVSILIILILTALLFPAVQAIRERANLSYCQNNLHQIGIASHAFYERRNGFQPAVSTFVHLDGLSRTILCPTAPGKRETIDYNATVSITGEIGDILKISQLRLPGCLTPNRLTKSLEIMDGLSNTVMMVEDAGEMVAWDMPIGYIVVGENSMVPCRNKTIALNCTNERQIFSYHQHGANMLFADGSVKFVQENISFRTLQSIITRAGDD